MATNPTNCSAGKPGGRRCRKVLSIAPSVQVQQLADNEPDTKKRAKLLSDAVKMRNLKACYGAADAWTKKIVYVSHSLSLSVKNRSRDLPNIHWAVLHAPEPPMPIKWL